MFLIAPIIRDAMEPPIGYALIVETRHSFAEVRDFPTPLAARIYAQREFPSLVEAQ
jgi:hypothetical protein